MQGNNQYRLTKGKRFTAQVLTDLQGEGYVRQKSISAESTFVTFGAPKVKGLAAMSGECYLVRIHIV